MASVEIDVLVIGAGVSGLTTAICLAERGLSVLVLARELPAETYSNAAGAMWGPCLADHERVPEWSRETLAVLKNLAEEPGTGVALLAVHRPGRRHAGIPGLSRTSTAADRWPDRAGCGHLTRGRGSGERGGRQLCRARRPGAGRRRRRRAGARAAGCGGEPRHRHVLW